MFRPTKRFHHIPRPRQSTKSLYLNFHCPEMPRLSCSPNEVNLSTRILLPTRSLSTIPITFQIYYRVPQFLDYDILTNIQLEQDNLTPKATQPRRIWALPLGSCRLPLDHLFSNRNSIISLQNSYTSIKYTCHPWLLPQKSLNQDLHLYLLHITTQAHRPIMTATQYYNNDLHVSLSIKCNQLAHTTTTLQTHSPRFPLHA